MPIVYAKWTVSVHGLGLKTAAELDQLQQRMLLAVRDVLPPETHPRLDGDVEIELCETAGNPDSGPPINGI